MKLVLQQSTQLPLRSFRQLGRDLGIAHPLLAVEVVDHPNQCTHICCQPKDIDTFRDPHGRMGMSQGVGHRRFPSEPRRTPAIFRTRLNPTLKLPMGLPSRPQKGCSSSDGIRPSSAVRNDFSSARNRSTPMLHTVSRSPVFPRTVRTSRVFPARVRVSLHGAALLHPPVSEGHNMQDEVNIARAVGGGVINS
jgi:hypothetical protein